MSYSWCPCLNSTCCDEQTYQVTPHQQLLNYQQYQQPQQIIQHKVSNQFNNPLLVGPNGQITSKIQSQPTLQSKVLASQIKTNNSAIKSIIKDTSVVKSPLIYKQGMEDSIIFGKFDSLLHGSTSQLVEPNIVSGSHAKPQQAITPIMNVKPALAQIPINNFAPMRYIQPQPQPIRATTPIYNQIPVNPYMQRQTLRRF